MDGLYTFDDAGPGDFPGAAAALPDAGIISPGGYHPTTNTFTGVVATTNPTTSLVGTFGGLDREATWTLFISDNFAADIGSVSAWSLTLTTQDEEGPGAVPEPSAMILGGLAVAIVLGCGLGRRAISARRR